MDWTESEARFRAAPGPFQQWKESQNAAYEKFLTRDSQRLLLFFPTGEGKSKTSLALVSAAGYDEAIVIAPPGVHASWEADAKALGMKLRLDSVQKFRMSETKYPAGVPWIVDEFHKMGGHGAQGFKKLNRMSRKITTPMILCSATPNYNDYERCFCADVLLDDNPIRDYGTWIYKNCETEVNRFGYYPIITGLLNYDSPAEYLYSQPWTAYVEDRAVWRSEILDLETPDYSVFERYGLLVRENRIVASLMEKSHARVRLQLIDDDGFIRPEVLSKVLDTISDKKWIIFCAHSRVAEALSLSLGESAVLLTGETANKEVVKKKFLETDVHLIATSALAEGIDGLDKVCQSMLILDDIVGDDAKRRQLIGRILPRGLDDDKERIVVTAK